MTFAVTAWCSACGKFVQAQITERGLLCMSCARYADQQADAATEERLKKIEERLANEKAVERKVHP